MGTGMTRHRLRSVPIRDLRMCGNFPDAAPIICSPRRCARSWLGSLEVNGLEEWVACSISTTASLTHERPHDDALDAVLAANRVFCRWRRVHSRSEIGTGAYRLTGPDQSRRIWRVDGHRHALLS